MDRSPRIGQEEVGEGWVQRGFISVSLARGWTSAEVPVLPRQTQKHTSI